MNRKLYGIVMLIGLYLGVVTGMSFAIGFWPAIIITTGSLGIMVWISVAVNLLATGKCWS